MSTLTSSNSISGVVEGVSHSASGSAATQITAVVSETFEVDTSYYRFRADSTATPIKALIVNHGAEEITVRYQCDLNGGPLYRFVVVPPGAFIELHGTAQARYGEGAYRISDLSVKTDSGTCMVTVHQALI